MKKNWFDYGHFWEILLQNTNKYARIKIQNANIAQLVEQQIRNL